MDDIRSRKVCCRDPVYTWAYGKILGDQVHIDGIGLKKPVSLADYIPCTLLGFKVSSYLAHTIPRFFVEETPWNQKVI
jgi:hypothetical protein